MYPRQQRAPEARHVRRAMRWAAATLLALLLPASVRAAEGPVFATAQVRASLVADTDAYAPGRALRLGLRLRLAPGWHTYWTNPGDAGAPPELALALPPGATAGPIRWPGPEALPEGPLMAYAYTGDVVLPFALTPGAGDGPLTVRAHASWLVCATLCVPQEGDLALTLPQGTPAPSAEAPLLAAAQARVPVPGPAGARIAPDGTLTVTAADIDPARVHGARFFPAAAGALTDAAAQALAVRPGGLTLSLRPGPHFDPKAGLDGVLALDGPAGTRFLTLAAAPGPLPAPARDGLARTVLLALAGGLLLNLMPCVFPVLAMKAVGLARLSGQARSQVRAEAASYVAGVLLACLALGGTMLGLRAAGEAAGWGFQFQSPAFVVAMALVLFAVGLVLSGVVTPGARAAGMGQSLAARGGHAGSLCTGLLAVVVATPCTAPFMGAAIAAALAAPPAQALAVFAALGLGLAAPYALLALRPGLARLLPRPGPWMEVLRQALAFPMYAACAWLVWVAAVEAGPPGVLAAASALVLAGLAAWCWRLAGEAGGLRRGGRRVAGGAALLAGLAALAAPAMLAALPGAAPAEARAAGTEAFSEARLDALRAQGRPVFVNMTASWCVTCLVNERLALDPAPVRDAFARRGVAYLEGDWTRQDPQVTAFLRQHGRDGVPLYVLYPAGGGEPAVLPQILTEATVLAALGG